jgi:hypothetical protein
VKQIYFQCQIHASMIYKATIASMLLLVYFLCRGVDFRCHLYVCC